MNVFLLLSLFFLLQSCGVGIIETGKQNYEPKIVMEGYLIPGQSVQEIKITRNIPLNTAIERSDLVLREARVKLTCLNDGSSYLFEYSPSVPGFHYYKKDLKIEYGKKYRLDVDAVIDGVKLHAYATTRVPFAGLSVLKALTSDSIRYLEKDRSGALTKPNIAFNRSPQTDFYSFSIAAMEADSTTFIYPPVNPYLGEDVSPKEVQNNLLDYIYSADFIFNTPLTDGREIHALDWFHFHFYGWYKIIISAGDQNMKDYLLTYKRIYENDGNLHEPVFHVDGDGLGVFGSSVNDTMYMKILR